MLPFETSQLLWSHSGFFQCSECFFSYSWLLTFKWKLTLYLLQPPDTGRPKLSRGCDVRRSHWWSLSSCGPLQPMNCCCGSGPRRWYAGSPLCPFCTDTPSLDNELHLLAAGEHMNHSIIPHQPPVLDLLYELLSALLLYAYISFLLKKRWYFNFV